MKVIESLYKRLRKYDIDVEIGLEGELIYIKILNENPINFRHFLSVLFTLQLYIYSYANNTFYCKFVRDFEKYIPTSIGLRENEYMLLQQFANKNGLTVSSLIRRAIRKMIEGEINDNIRG